MIQSFRDADTEHLFQQQRSRRLSSEVQVRALRKLELLHRAERLEDLRLPPSNRLEALAGDRWGQHSIRITRRWRICFHWQDGNAYGDPYVTPTEALALSISGGNPPGGISQAYGN